MSWVRLAPGSAWAKETGCDSKFYSKINFMVETHRRQKRSKKTRSLKLKLWTLWCQSCSFWTAVHYLQVAVQPVRKTLRPRLRSYQFIVACLITIASQTSVDWGLRKRTTFASKSQNQIYHDLLCFGQRHRRGRYLVPSCFFVMASPSYRVS